MAQTVQTDERALGVAKALGGLAVISVLVAAAAGLILIATTPESGSTMEAALGITAAISGLATAGFSIAAIIYAQVKNLWQYAPTWVRVAAWAVIAFAIVTSLWSWIT